MALDPRQREEAVRARVAPTARGIVNTATRPLFRDIRGAVVDSIDRCHQLVVGVVDVAMRGVRNEVLATINHTLGLPREGVAFPAQARLKRPCRSRMLPPG